MMPPDATRLAEILERLERLEVKVRAIEGSSQAGQDRLGAERDSAEAAEMLETAESTATVRQAEDVFEFEVGHVWFSRVGITVLALGAAFALSLPYSGVSSWVPSLVGLTVVVAVLFSAHRWSAAFGPIAGFLRGGGLLLLYFSTLRLFFFGSAPALHPGSLVGCLVLSMTPIACLFVAGRYRSEWLAGIALGVSFVTAALVPLPWFTLMAIMVLAVVAVFLSRRYSWPWVLPLSVFLSNGAFLLAMLNRPILGNPVQWTIEPPASPAFALVFMVIFALGSLLRRDAPKEGPSTVASSFLNALLWFLAFFLSTEAGIRNGSGVPYAIATVTFLAVASAFWVREESRWSTFVYSMTGYLALTVAISRFTDVPDIFIWLSLQSLVVVATAVWFQSRFIVAANFLIYLATVGGYLALAEVGSGISFVFGAVALGSARILHWKKDRLHLQTEFMRNCYLACGFLAFPYAAYHLVPGQFVSISWVVIAGFYYLMNLVVRSRKYRWMGHGTLLGTVAYLIVVGITQLKPEHRILSFVVLGLALVGVSIVFSFLRSRRRSDSREDAQD